MSGVIKRFERAACLLWEAYLQLHSAWAPFNACDVSRMWRDKKPKLRCLRNISGIRSSLPRGPLRYHTCRCTPDYLRKFSLDFPWNALLKKHDRNDFSDLLRMALDLERGAEAFDMFLWLGKYQVAGGGSWRGKAEPQNPRRGWDMTIIINAGAEPHAWRAAKSSSLMSLTMLLELKAIWVASWSLLLASVGLVNIWWYMSGREIRYGGTDSCAGCSATATIVSRAVYRDICIVAGLIPCGECT